MFDIGFFEIIVIAVVALIVVGPDEFPGLVRSVGRAIGKLRQFLSSVKQDFDYEIDKANELKDMIAKETELSELHNILDPDAPTVPVKGKAQQDKVDSSNEAGQGETDEKPAEPVSDRHPNQHTG